MNEMYKNYQEWYLKWIRVFRQLVNLPNQTPKVKRLIDLVKRHLWNLEWRMLCYKWYGDDKAEQSSLWVSSLK